MACTISQLGNELAAGAQQPPWVPPEAEDASKLPLRTRRDMWPVLHFPEDEPDEAYPADALAGTQALLGDPRLAGHFPLPLGPAGQHRQPLPEAWLTECKPQSNGNTGAHTAMVIAAHCAPPTLDVAPHPLPLQSTAGGSCAGCWCLSAARRRSASSPPTAPGRPGSTARPGGPSAWTSAAWTCEGRAPASPGAQQGGPCRKLFAHA